MASLSKYKVVVGCMVLMIFQNIQTTNFLEVYTILSRYLQNPNQVGEIAPLSRAAGNQLVDFVVKVDDDSGPACYLEVGGGCGAVSVCIASKLRKQDTLHVIEIDPKMCKLLKERLKKYSNVTVYCCSILDWKPDRLYDGIISTLPFNSLGLVLTKQILEHLQLLASPGCLFSYVEYPIVRQLLRYFYGQQRREQFEGVQKTLQYFRDQYLQQKKLIYCNVPPIMVYQLVL